MRVVAGGRPEQQARTEGQTWFAPVHDERAVGKVGMRRLVEPALPGAREPLAVQLCVNRIGSVLARVKL